MSKAHDLGSEQPGDYLALLLVGAEQSGKSRLAATAPSPVLFLDADLKAASLAGRKGVYALSYQDSGDTNKMPAGYSELVDDVNKLATKNSLRTLRDQWPDEPVRTLVFDSVASIASLARKYLLYSNPDIAYVVTLGSRTYRSPKSWTGWMAEKDALTDLLFKARSIPDMNVIATLHECMEEAENSTEQNPIFTGRIEVFPRRYNDILKYFSEIWRITRDQGQLPTVIVNPDGKFTKAGNTFGLKSVNEPDIKKIIEQVQKGDLGSLPSYKLASGTVL